MSALEVSVLLTSFLLLLALGVPVAYCIGLSSLAGLLISVSVDVAVTTIAQRMVTGLDSFALLAIPFFILVGQIMNRGGLARRLIEFARSLVGMLPGGLAYVNIVASMLFGAVSGSAIAAASAIGGAMTQPMAASGFPRPFSAAVNITSATTGMIIPPSNILIVYSLASGGVSVAALFLAGYVPGLLLGIALMAVAGVIAQRARFPVGAPLRLAEVGTKFIGAVPSLLLLVIVIGGIVGGVFTATEASAVAVVYALGLGFVYRELKWADLPRLLLGAVATTGVVALLIATSMAMSWVMAFDNIPQQVSDSLLSLSDDKLLVLMIINGVLLVVGMFMDMTPAVLIFTPIFLPVVTRLGVHPTHFGIMMILNLCIGLCSPPVGSVLFVGCGVAQVSIRQVFRPLLPLFIAMLCALALVTYVPALSLWLPSLFDL